MQISKNIIVSFVCYLLCAGFTANAAVDQSITYKNQRGSIMTLTWHSSTKNTGTLTGTFTTMVGKCAADVGVPVPLSGFFNGNAVAITFNFPHCQQVVAMTGHLTDQNNALSTLWLDATLSHDPIHKDWDANITGADYYKREINI
ncbi:hypothetical protein BH10PSE19_BH10PSE19_14320 [soil metagenome]